MEPQKDRSQSMIPFRKGWNDPCGSYEGQRLALQSAKQAISDCGLCS